MSADTNVKLKGHILPEQILAFIKENFDKNAEISESSSIQFDMCEDFKKSIKQKYHPESIIKTLESSPASQTRTINFIYHGEKRAIFYIYDNFNCYENLKYYKKRKLENMVKSETTFLSFGYWGNSVEIMQTICAAFGGWVDENDCDDEEYYYIPKSDTAKPVEVKRVTMEEIYKKFGCVVIIEDD